MGDSELTPVAFLKGRTENAEEKYIPASPVVLEWITVCLAWGHFPPLLHREKVGRYSLEGNSQEVEHDPLFVSKFTDRTMDHNSHSLPHAPALVRRSFSLQWGKSFSFD